MLPEKVFLKLLNKKFLTDLLDETVIEYSVSTGSKQGDNLAGSLVAVNIRTQDRKILHIIIKTPPYDNPGSCMYVKKWRLFDLENRFYSFLAPNLELLYKARNGPESSLNLPIPRYYGGTSEYLALEDVRPAGFKMVDKFKGLTFPEVQLVMKCLGKLHASTYSYIKAKGEDIFAEKENHVFHNTIVRNHYFPEHDALAEKAFDTVYFKGVELLSRKHPALGAKLKKCAPVPHEMMLGISGQTDKKYFPVISHGDIWGNNLIFKYETVIKNGLASEEVKECMILDFQQTRRENIFWDLLYFMYTSTTPAFRKEFLVQSLMVYYDSFVEVAGEFKTPLPIGFSRGWLVDEFFENLPNIFAFMPFAISLQLGDFTVMGLQSPAPVSEEELERVLPWETYFETMIDLCSTLLEHSPVALARLEAVALELDALRAFDD